MIFDAFKSSYYRNVVALKKIAGFKTDEIRSSCSAGRLISTFMESKSLLPCSRELSILPYLQPFKSTPHSHQPISVRSNLVLSFDLHLRPSSDSSLEISDILFVKSGLWRRVVRWVSTDVSEEHIASIFKVEGPVSSTLKIEAICFSEASVETQGTTRRHIPEYYTLHNHRCEDLKSYILFVNLSSPCILHVPPIALSSFRHSGAFHRYP
jgi:hypothetical protein